MRPSHSHSSLPQSPSHATHLLQSTSLPKAPFAALCAIRLVDPIVFTQVFPYINEFITRLNVTSDPSQIGLYSGLVESSFAVAQLLSIYQCARISDIVGRRPVVLIGTLGMVISTAFLGISSCLPQIILFRSFAGLCSGNVAVIHSVLGELTNSSNQASAFSIFAIFWPLGAIIGPLIGGSLSDPATKYPHIFNVPFWTNFPYFLPCFVSALLGLIGIVLAYFYLDETLPKRTSTIPKGARVTESYGATDTQHDALSAPHSTSVASLLSDPVIRALSTSGFALCFIATAFDVVFVLFCYSPIHVGGLAFSASRIGYSLSTAGAISAGIQLLFLPTLLRIFETTKFYSFCMGVWPLTFAALPFLNLLARYESDPGTGSVPAGTQVQIWIGIGIVLGLSRIACLAYSINMILVKEHAPSPSSLGATNGLVQFSMCFARAISPAFVSSIFSYSVDKNFLQGHCWVVGMVLLSFLGINEAKAVHNSLKRRNNDSR